MQAYQIRIGAKIGEGTAGTVWKGEMDRLTVAVKQIKEVRCVGGASACAVCIARR